MLWCLEAFGCIWQAAMAEIDKAWEPKSLKESKV